MQEPALSKQRAEFERLVTHESGEIDGHLDEGALRIAAAVDPTVDVAAEVQRLDALADELTATDAETLALELFGTARFSGNGINYYEPENSLLPKVLDRGVGIPISLAVLFIEIGRRKHIQIEGVGMPGHFLTRCGDVWYDPFHAGARLDEQGCEALYQRLAGRPVKLLDGMLDPTPPAKILERMLWNLQRIADGRDDRTLARSVLALLSTFPTAPVQVRVAWATTMANAGQFDRAAQVARQAADLVSGDSRERLLDQATSWEARLN